MSKQRAIQLLQQRRSLEAESRRVCGEIDEVESEVSKIAARVRPLEERRDKLDAEIRGLDSECVACLREAGMAGGIVSVDGRGYEVVPASRSPLRRDEIREVILSVLEEDGPAGKVGTSRP